MTIPRILIVTEVFYPEEFNINDVALSWKKKGYLVDVLTLSPTYPSGNIFPGYKNSFFSKEVYQGINVFRIFSVTGYRDSVVRKILRYVVFMILGSIAAVFIGRRYSHVFGFNLGSLTDMVPIVIIRKIYNKRTMFWVQDVWPDSVYAYGFKKTKLLSFLLDKFVGFMFRNVDCVAVSGKGFKSKLEPYIEKNLYLNYIPNWASDLDMSVTPAFLSSVKKVHFTFAGNIGKVQNLENIIKAFLLLPLKYREKSQLNIIGDGSNLENLKSLANNNPGIVFHQKKMRKDMAKFYVASDFLIISLIDESIFSATVPGKTQTYIAAKKPILAVINGEVADIVNQNNLGISTSPSNIDLIKGALKKCIDMPENEKSKFMVNNEKLLKETFDRDKVINNMTNQLIDY